MPGLEELRAGLRGQTVQKTGTPAWLTAAFVVCAAFAVGAILVVGWNRLPANLIPPAADKKETVAAILIAPSANRLGRAETAPILGRCIRARDPHYYENAPADLLYGALKGGSMQSRVRAVLGKPSKDQARTVAESWASLADCVYRQDANALCDPDSRLLAVEAAISLVRQPRQNPSNDPPDIDIERAKEQMLAALRTRLRDGVLIAADFGLFAPGEIKRVIADINPIRNICPQTH